MQPERLPVITAYCSNCKSVEIRDLSHAASFPEDVVWIDMIEPTRDEELYVEKILGIEVPTRDDLKDIEPSARLYVENDAVFMPGPQACLRRASFPPANSNALPPASISRRGGNR